MLDFFLNLIWLPIGTANTWGFRSAHEAFMTTYNGTGAPAGWNWCLSYLATAGILIGFDASGHVAEETKNASVTAARGIFWSTVASGFGGLATIILFLFCAVGANSGERLYLKLTVINVADCRQAHGVWISTTFCSPICSCSWQGRSRLYEHYLHCSTVASKIFQFPLSWLW